MFFSFLTTLSLLVVYDFYILLFFLKSFFNIKSIVFSLKNFISLVFFLYPMFLLGYFLFFILFLIFKFLVLLYFFILYFLKTINFSNRSFNSFYFFKILALYLEKLNNYFLIISRANTFDVFFVLIINFFSTFFYTMYNWVILFFEKVSFLFLHYYEKYTSLYFFQKSNVLSPIQDWLRSFFNKFITNLVFFFKYWFTEIIKFILYCSLFIYDVLFYPF